MGFDSKSISEFNNERPGNLVHWRIVEQDYRKKNDWPPFFVYRIVEGPTGGSMSEYLHKDGQVDSVAGTEGFFSNYAEIGMALVLNHGREDAAGYKGFYTECYRTWLEAKKHPEKSTCE
jgi:hypothetical protein